MFSSILLNLIFECHICTILSVDILDYLKHLPEDSSDKKDTAGAVLFSAFV